MRPPDIGNLDKRPVTPVDWEYKRKLALTAGFGMAFDILTVDIALVSDFREVGDVSNPIQAFLSTGGAF